MIDVGIREGHYEKLEKNSYNEFGVTAAGFHVSGTGFRKLCTVLLTWNGCGRGDDHRRGLPDYS